MNFFAWLIIIGFLLSFIGGNLKEGFRIVSIFGIAVFVIYLLIYVSFPANLWTIFVIFGISWLIWKDGLNKFFK